MHKVRFAALAGTALATALTAAVVLDGAQASPFGNPALEGRLPTPDAVTAVPPVAREAAPAPVAQPSAARPAPAVPAPRARVADPEPRVQAAEQPVVAPAAAPTSAPEQAHAAGLDSHTDALRGLIADGRRLERLVPRETDRGAIAAFYEKNGFAPLWTGGPDDRARMVLTHLQGIEAEGLDPADYEMPSLAAAGAAERAEAELRFTAMLLTYARHAMDGRVHWSRVANDIDYQPSFNPAQVLDRVAAADNLAGTLQGFNPPHEGYRALRTRYDELRRQPDEASAPRIGDGPILRIAVDRQGRARMMSDPRVSLLRERLGVPAEDNDLYNRALADAVARFQKTNGLRVTGQFGPATRAALNPPDRAAQLAIMRANLERWRWLPRDFGRMHVTVNVPDYHLEVFNNGERVWRSRAVVGTREQPTALISDTIRTITVNPIWHPPPSIIYGKLMPAYQAGDRTVFERMGLRIERRQNGEIRVFHPPGERNPLGRLRFNFPNKFLVYMHDTPERHLFSRPSRAFSHGCVRVEDPERFAEILLSMGLPRAGATRDQIRRMYGHQEHDIRLQGPIRVHQTYQTAFVDDSGRLQFREDIYGIDRKITELLTGAERRIADQVKERPGDPNYEVQPQDRQWLNQVATRNTAPNPFALFHDLFR